MSLFWPGILGGQITKAPPPSGFTLGSNGKYYRLYNGSYTRASALSTAAADGGWLFVPQSSADRTAAINTASYGSLNMWMGMTFNELGDFEARVNSTNHPLNGQVFTYQDWAMGWPTGSGPFVFRSTANNGWVDGANVNSTYSFIAEWY